MREGVKDYIQHYRKEMEPSVSFLLCDVIDVPKIPEYSSDWGGFLILFLFS